MTVPTSTELFRFLDGQDFEFEALIPGWSVYNYDTGNFEKATGTVDTAAGTLEHVKHWNAFDEGNEQIFIVFKIEDTFFLAELYNDSWNSDGGGWDIRDIKRVEPREVTEVRYVEIEG